MAKRQLSPEQKKAMVERLARAREAKAAKKAEEEAKVTPRTREQEIVHLYQIGNSAQAIARTFKTSVEEVLDLVGEGQINNVQFVGDQIDEQEMGREAVYNAGNEYRVPFTTD